MTVRSPDCGTARYSVNSRQPCVKRMRSPRSEPPSESNTSRPSVVPASLPRHIDPAVNPHELPLPDGNGAGSDPDRRPSQWPAAHGSASAAQACRRRAERPECGSASERLTSVPMPSRGRPLLLPAGLEHLVERFHVAGGLHVRSPLAAAEFARRPPSAAAAS